MITKETILKIKQEISLLDYARKYVPDLKSVGNNNYMSKCPNPGHVDSTPSFNIWYDTGKSEWKWCCHGCHCGPISKTSSVTTNYGTDIIAFYRWINQNQNYTFEEAIRNLAKENNIFVEEDKNYKEYQKLNNLAMSYNYNIDLIKPYLYSRGLNDKDIAKWKIGFISHKESGIFVERITFPLFDRNNRILGFSMRKSHKVSDYISKYKNSRNSEIFNKSTYLYGLNNLDKNCKEIRITEGVMDVILADKYGVKNIVCVLGTAFTDKHAEIIKNLNLTPVLCFDNDEAGQKATKRAIEIFSKYNINPKVCNLPDNINDLGDFANEIKYSLEDYIISHSKPAWQKEIDLFLDEYNTKINNINREYIPKFKDIQNRIYDKTEQIVVQNYISKQVGVYL